MGRIMEWRWALIHINLTAMQGFLFCRVYDWLRWRLDRWSCLCHQEAELGAPMSKCYDVTVPDEGLFHWFAVYKGAVCALVYELKAVPFADDPGMFPGHDSEVPGKGDLTRRVPSYGYLGLSEFLYLTL